MNVHIRLATEADATVIASVLLDSFLAFKPQYTEKGFDATTATADQVRTRIGEGPGWVAVMDGTIVGTVSAKEQRETLYLRGMAVLPAARGVRIGEVLLQYVEAFARAHGHERLLLSTTPFLDAAIRLYENFGFRRVDEGPNDLFGTPLFTMEKHLSREK